MKTHVTGIAIVLAIALAIMLGVAVFVKGRHIAHPGNHAVSSGHAHIGRDQLPKEGGQSAFAALSEIVGLLENNPDTDWQHVNIDALRDHLVDMNRLVLSSRAQSVVSDSVVQFTVVAEPEGNSATVDAMHRMVPAHAAYIEQSRGWSIDTQLGEHGAVLDITVENEADALRLKALGFYGFMSLDSHHQAHHYQMALGATH